MDDTEWSIDQYESILGAPIYGSAPFLSEKNRLIENRELKEICVHYVMQSGKEDFFQRESWETQLRQIVSDYRNSRKECDLFETQKEQQERIVLNLQQAKTMIETKLDNLNVRHLAYPWGAGSPMAIRCSQQMGIVSNFWATISNKSTNLPQSDPFRIVRHKHDFIWRLPGEGRKSLKDFFLLKLRRRARGQIDY